MMGVLDWRMRDNRLGGLYMDMGTDTRSLEAEVMVGGGIRPSKGSKDLYTMSNSTILVMKIAVPATIHCGSKWTVSGIYPIVMSPYQVRITLWRGWPPYRSMLSEERHWYDVPWLRNIQEITFVCVRRKSKEGVLHILQTNIRNVFVKIDEVLNVGIRESEKEWRGFC